MGADDVVFVGHVLSNDALSHMLKQLMSKLHSLHEGLVYYLHQGGNVLGSLRLFVCWQDFPKRLRMNFTISLKVEP